MFFLNIPAALDLLLRRHLEFESRTKGPVWPLVGDLTSETSRLPLWFEGTDRWPNNLHNKPSTEQKSPLPDVCTANHDSDIHAARVRFRALQFSCRSEPRALSSCGIPFMVDTTRVIQTAWTPPSPTPHKTLQCVHKRIGHQSVVNAAGGGRWRKSLLLVQLSNVRWQFYRSLDGRGKKARKKKKKNLRGSF